jgi:hypothetical protein
MVELKFPLGFIQFNFNTNPQEQFMVPYFALNLSTFVSSIQLFLSLQVFLYPVPFLPLVQCQNL